MQWLKRLFDKVELQRQNARILRCLRKAPMAACDVFLIRDGDPRVKAFTDVRETLLRGIPDRVPRRVLKEIVGCLTHKENMIRHDAAVALGRLGDPLAFEPLVHALEVDDWVEHEASGAIRESKVSPATKTQRLVRLLSSTTVPKVKVRVLRLLQDLPVPPPSTATSEMVSDPSEDVRQAAVSLMKRIDKDFTPLVKERHGLETSREPGFTVISGDIDSWAAELNETDAEFGEMYYQCPKCGYSIRINDIGKMMLKTGIQTFRSQFGERECKKCGTKFIAHEHVRRGDCPDFDYQNETQW